MINPIKTKSKIEDKTPLNNQKGMGEGETRKFLREAKSFGGNDEIILRTIDISDDVPVKEWERWLSYYGDINRMECIGHHQFRPVIQFVFGECPICGEQMWKAGVSWRREGIITAFCCGSHKKGAKHKFVWSKGFAFPLEGANVAMLASIFKKNDG